MLGERGAVISYHDPFVPALPELGLQSSPLDAGRPTPTRSCSSPPTPASTTSALVEQARLFVDLRGTTRGMRVQDLVRL